MTAGPKLPSQIQPPVPVAGAEGASVNAELGGGAAQRDPGQRCRLGRTAGVPANATLSSEMRGLRDLEIGRLTPFRAPRPIRLFPCNRKMSSMREITAHLDFVADPLAVISLQAVDDFKVGLSEVDR